MSNLITGGPLYLRIQYPRFQLSVVYRGPPKKNWEKLTWLNPAAQMRPILDSSSFVPIPTLPRKLATILLLAFSLFKLVAALLQCLCSESNKKNGEVSEYPQ